VILYVGIENLGNGLLDNRASLNHDLPVRSLPRRTSKVPLVNEILYQMPGQAHDSSPNSGDAPTVSTLGAEEATLAALEQALQDAKDEINSLKAQMNVSGRTNRLGNDSIGAVVRKRVKTTEEKLQVGEIRKTLKVIMIQHIFPREKFQSNMNLYFHETRGSLGKFIMGKIDPPVANFQEYWEGAWLVAKELFQEHRQSVAANLKKKFLKGTLNIIGVALYYKRTLTDKNSFVMLEIMTNIKWEEDQQLRASNNSSAASNLDNRCDPNFLVLWKLEEWEDGDFHAYVRTNEDRYYAFVKFCVPIVTGVNKWNNDLKCAIWNKNNNTLKSCGMLTEAEEGFAALIVENGWERWHKEARWRHDKGIAYDANTKLKSPNEVFGIYKWSDGGSLENTDGKKGRHDWSHSGLERYHGIQTIIKDSEVKYDYDHTSEEEETNRKSLMMKFREADVKWKKLHERSGTDNWTPTGNENREPSHEDKASKRQKRDEFLDTAFVTNWAQV